MGEKDEEMLDLDNEYLLAREKFEKDREDLLREIRLGFKKADRIYYLPMPIHPLGHISIYDLAKKKEPVFV